MSRTRKATKRAASRRHRASTAPTNANRPSSCAATAATVRPASPASTTATYTRAAATMTDAIQSNDTFLTTPPRTTPSPASSGHQDRRAHPDQAVLKERAFALSCVGLRSPAIAARLGVSERTVRHWNYTTLRTLALDATGVSSDLDTPTDPDASASTCSTSPNSPVSIAHDATASTAAPAPDTYRMEYHRALAIERQLDIAVTARAAYDHLMAQHDHLLAQYIAACDTNIAATATVATTTADEAAAAPSLPAAIASMARFIPQLASSASRQLQIAQAAHREVARLQGVTTYAQTDARLSAEYDVRQSLQASDPAEEQGGHVPIHFFDPSAAIAAITGGLDDDEDDDDKTATSTPAQNAPSLSGATSPAKMANSFGNDSGNISGNDSGNISGNGTTLIARATQSMPDPNPRR